MKVFGYKLSATESLIGLVLLTIVIYILYVKISKSVKDAKREKELKDIADDIAPANLSFEEETYKNWADNLHSAMARMGTDEQTIYNIFKKIQTKDDLMMLVVKFGQRLQPHNQFALVTPRPMNLSEFLNDELDESEMNQVNKILSDKGIKIQF